MARILTVFLLAIGCLAASGATAGNLTPDHASNMCLDFMGGKGHLRTCNPRSDSQNFKVPESSARSGPLQVAGACVELVGDGKPLIGARCRSIQQQHWILNRQTGALYNPRSRLCADVRGEGRDTGAEVIAYRCTGTANQRWKERPILVGVPRPVSLRPRHAESLCVDVEGGGSRLLLWRCHGQANQKFKLPEGVREGAIRSEDGKCLFTSSGVNVAGGKTAQCRYASSTWIADGTGQIRNTKFGTCLTVPNRSQRVGTVLVLEPCNRGAHQVFVRR